MTGKLVSTARTCIHPGCTAPGTSSFQSHPDDRRCPTHHDAEEKRRIAAIDAALGVFKALVG